MNHRTLLLYAVLVSTVCCSPARSQSLDGVWDIAMIVVDGRILTPADVRQLYSADGRLTIAGQTATLILPTTLLPRQVPLTIDASQAPATVDIALAAGASGQGIAMVNGDAAVICLASPGKPRAAAFTSLAGSGNLLLSLTRVPTVAPVAAAGAPAAPAALAPAPAPAYPPPMTLSDDQLRSLLVGTWGHQEKDVTSLITLNSDGTLSVNKTSKDAFKKLFHPDVRSSGTWKVEGGVVLGQFSASTDKRIRGQVYSYRIRSINDKELVAVDQNGQLRREWKSPTQ